MRQVNQEKGFKSQAACVDWSGVQLAETWDGWIVGGLSEESESEHPEPEPGVTPHSKLCKAES